MTDPETTTETRNSRKVREGLVVSAKMDKTVVVAVVDRVQHRRYRKTLQRTRKLYAHDEANEVREGDRIRITRPFGRHQDVTVRIVLDQHVKKGEARVLYDDVTPKPTAEEIEMRRMERVYRAATQAAGTPDRRRRREIRRSRGKV